MNICHFSSHPSWRVNHKVTAGLNVQLRPGAQLWMLLMRALSHACRWWDRVWGRASTRTAPTGAHYHPPSSYSWHTRRVHADAHASRTRSPIHQTDQERAWLVTRRWAVRCLQRSDPLRGICAGSDWSEVRQRSSWSHVLAKQLVKSMIRWFSWLYHCGNHDQSYQSAEEILVKRTIKPNNKKEKKKKKAEIALVDCKLKFGSNFLKSPTNESHFLSF